MERRAPLARRAAVGGLVLVGLAAAWGVLRLLGVSPAALVPRTLTSWLIVGGIVAVLVLWSRVAVPRLTRRPALRTTLRLAPVLALVAVVVVPATIDRETDEALLEGVPTAVPSPAADPTGAEGSPAEPSAPAGSTSEAAEPSGPPAPAPSEPSSEAPPEPERLSSGAVRGIGHVAEGEAAVWRAGPTSFVRLDLDDVQGAVDVVVWLVPSADQTTPDGGVDLGGLKGTRGTANYVVPEGVDVTRYANVLLWCRAFSTPIAVAPQA